MWSDNELLNKGAKYSKTTNNWLESEGRKEREHTIESIEILCSRVEDKINN